MFKQTTNLQTIDDFYSRIPNKLFYVKDQDGMSILAYNNFNYKTLTILDFLYMNTTRRNIVKFNLKDMVTECGFIPDTRANKSNAQFQKILSHLKETGIINSDFDFETIKPNELVSCSLEIDFGEGGYFQLYDSEKEKILNQTIASINNIALLAYYCYLKSRIYKRSKDEGDIRETAGRSEVCYPTYETISKDVGITDDTINKYNDILVELDLIRIGSAGLWYYKGDSVKSLKESPNIYTLFQGDEELANYHLQQAIKFWKSMDFNENKIFIGKREYKNNIRQLNGELGSIIKKEKHGKATPEDLARKKEILASTQPDTDKYKLMALMDSNEGEILSNISSASNIASNVTNSISPVVSTAQQTITNPPVFTSTQSVVRKVYGSSTDIANAVSILGTQNFEYITTKKPDPSSLTSNDIVLGGSGIIQNYDDLQKVSGLTMLSGETAEGTKKAILDWKNMHGYKFGGINTTTGLAMLHGTPADPEVIVNSSDTSKLWDFIQNKLNNNAISKFTPSSTPSISSSGNIGDISINLTVQGNVDKTVLPDIKKTLNSTAENLKKELNKMGIYKGH